MQIQISENYTWQQEKYSSELHYRNQRCKYIHEKQKLKVNNLYLGRLYIPQEKKNILV